MNHGTENFSKTVWRSFFGTFCSRYQIIQSKDSFLYETDDLSGEGTVHVS